MNKAERVSLHGLQARVEALETLSRHAPEPQLLAMRVRHEATARRLEGIEAALNAVTRRLNALGAPAEQHV